MIPVTRQIIRVDMALIRSVLFPEMSVRLVGLTVSNCAEPRAISPSVLPIVATVAA